jgi:GTPase SAR1 family protein
MSPQADYIWKIVVGGQGGVGKTTFITRYLTGQFMADTALTGWEEDQPSSLGLGGGRSVSFPSTQFD